MKKNKCMATAVLASWLVGAFDTLERKFLREFLFIVYLDPALPTRCTSCTLGGRWPARCCRGRR